MDDRCDVVVAAGLHHQVVVGNVAHHEGCVADGLGVAEFEGVVGHDASAGLSQRSDRVRADVAGAAGHQDGGCHRG